MDSDGVSEVFGAILAFSITSLLIFTSLIVFDSAADQARRTAETAEAVAIAETMDNAFVDLLRLKDETGISSYQYYPNLPAKIQGSTYTIEIDLNNLNLTTSSGISVIFPLQVSGVSDLTLVPSSTSPSNAIIEYKASPSPQIELL